MKLVAESTVFNDDKVQEKFAELVVDADGIRTEVGKKVGNTEVISRINQSAESVKIQADKVNIEGAAIFTGSGRLSETSLDSAYDANGAATGAVNTLKNDLASASGTTTINGGHIVTNTLNASAVKADSGTFNTANIPSLSSEKITVGSQTLTTALNGKAASGAENTANNYITDIGNDGIRVHDSHTSNNSVVINSGGTEIFKGGTTDTYSVAKYGDIARIGKAASKHISIDATNGMQVWTGTESDSTNVAQFNDTVRVGKISSNNIEISSTAFEVNDADDFTQFSITPSSTATSHTSTGSMPGLSSGSTVKTTLPKNITSFRITVYPSSGSASTATISIPATTAGATQSKTVGVATVTLKRLTANGRIEFSVKYNSQGKSSRYWYTSLRRVANITAGGYDLCYTAGDYIGNYEWTGASFLTNSKQKIDVVLPINKPILAESVTVSSAELTTRQGGNYTHGSSSSESASWTVDSATLTGGGIRLVLSNTTTTNAANNDAIGIYLSCNITFS